MAATSTTETWDAAWTLTMRAHRKRLTDNIFDAYPTLEMFKKAGLETEDGAKEIKEDLLYGKNTANWFSDYDEQNTDAVDGITAAFYPWRYIAVPITISMTEEMESRKSDAAKKLLLAKTEQSMNTIRDTVNAAIYTAQTGKAMLGLQDLIADDPTAGTLGGINRANESWFRNKNFTTSTNFNNKTGDVYDGFDAFSQLWVDCTEGNEKPTDIFTTTTLFGEGQSIFEGTGYARLDAGDKGVADAGFPVFRGATIRYDRDCPSQHAYMINRKYTKLKIQKGLNFAKTPFKEPYNQFAKVAYVIVGIQMTTNNPRRSGVATTLT